MNTSQPPDVAARLPPCAAPIAAARAGIASALLLWSAALAAPSTAWAQPVDRSPFDRPLVNRPTGEGLRGQPPTEPLSNRVSRPWVQSDWAPAHKARARLVAGTVAAGGQGRLLAGVEIRMAPDWKTYWRHPGDDGGIPPRFDFSSSQNLARAHVLYPAPHRIKGLTGYTVGYKDAVVFPVEIEASDPGRPIVLGLTLDYGICREICVPAEARLRLEIPPRLSGSPPGLGPALASVPRPAGKGRPTDPSLVSAKAKLTGSQPALDFEIATGTAAEVDLLVETADGRYLPLPRKIGSVSDGRQRFRVSLAGVGGIAGLAGTSLRLTMLSAGSGAETTWTVR